MPHQSISKVFRLASDQGERRHLLLGRFGSAVGIIPNSLAAGPPSPVAVNGNREKKNMHDA
ncbi:hypothetical protein CFIMG_008508RA00001 [Ceratocystis fimbriata CBS 114723]|uniref:Uncharacterized protein n=1 Tax=Ceratocystis fimbriata CBS 114723 TaxID=1035309 RepID=A0A2C5XIQ0_9PEZI|nr:hypothetical protein CFIMG_008508RA00001 [Ceratocystis fimbriata CBS 114723]